MQTSLSSVSTARNSRGGFTGNAWCCFSVARINGCVTGSIQWARAREAQVPHCGTILHSKEGSHTKCQQHPIEKPQWKECSSTGCRSLPQYQHFKGVSVCILSCGLQQETELLPVIPCLSQQVFPQIHIIGTSKALKTLTGTQGPLLKLTP